jgi:hypothetical protein
MRPESGANHLAPSRRIPVGAASPLSVLHTRKPVPGAQQTASADSTPVPGQRRDFAMFYSDVLLLTQIIIGVYDSNSFLILSVGFFYNPHATRSSEI